MEKVPFSYAYAYAYVTPGLHCLCLCLCLCFTMSLCKPAFTKLTGIYSATCAGFFGPALLCHWREIAVD